MKKIAVLMLGFILASSLSWAQSSPDAQRRAHREAMKAVKAAQREARKNAPAVPANKEPGFWAREGERSGLGSMKNPTGFLRNLNPMPFFKTQQEQYNARKNQGQTT